MRKLLLVDGNSMLFRGYYATIYSQPMKTSTGVPTNAVYAFATMLNKALELLAPDAVLVAFDAGKKTFRHDLYKEYKGGRKDTPEDLIPQFGLVRDYLDAFGIYRCELEGIEADDIIGTVAKQYEDWDINILSSDRDLLQLIDATTTVLLMKKGISEMEEMNEEKLQETLGIVANQITDLKGLMGDASDNIPGIPSVGEKTALKLLSKYQSVEGLLDRTDELAGKLKEKVIEFADQARLSKELATIKTDVALPFILDECLYNPQFESVIRFFDKNEMKSLVQKMKPHLKNETESSSQIADQQQVFQVVKRCPKSFFVENTKIELDYSMEDFYQSELMGMAFLQHGEVVYIRLEDLLQDEKCLEWMASDMSKITYDTKRLMREFERSNIKVSGLFYDVMIATFLCDSNLTTWDRVKQKYNFLEKNTMSDIYGTESKPKLPDFEQQTEATVERLFFLDQLYLTCKTEVAEYDLEDLFNRVEMPLVRILFQMEREGICIDAKVLDEIAEDALQQLNQLTKSIYKHSEREFNIKSPKQLAEVLFDELDLPGNKKRSTSVDVLEKLQGIHPIIDDLMEYRRIQKFYSTYAEGLKKYIHKDGKIHTIYHQCSTQTGRLSSTEPNMQNISVRDEQARKIRRAFIPTPGNLLLAADYSQVELRILAHMANEAGLIEAFKTGEDIHIKTASDVFGVDSSEVTSVMRRQAKAVNFGVVYGISEFGLSQQLGISRADAKKYIDTYFEKYPRIKEYMDEVVEECQQKGYVTTLLNRRREIHEIHDKNHMVREFGKRAAMNAPIQGSAADLIKLAMIKIQSELDMRQLKSKMILQVHDELIFDVVKDEVEIMKSLIEEGMTTALELKVPLLAECKQGNTWYEVK
ncbi:MAG: DNA polymerase I [Anaerorhabdus sp.]